MLTVRFPSGFSVQYNTAHQVRNRTEGSRFCDLYTRAGVTGEWVAQVPATCIIESVSPCRTYNPIATDGDKVQAEVALLSKEVRSLKRKLEKSIAG